MNVRDRVRRYGCAVCGLATLLAGCTAPAPPAWIARPSRVVEIGADIGEHPLPLALRLPEFGFLDFGLPSTTITVLRDGLPASMQASVLSFVAVPPQGRDSFETRSRRVLLVWTADRRTEGLMAAGSHFPAIIEPFPDPCCSSAQVRERRWFGLSVLDVQGEQQWPAMHGSVTIAPPRLRGACSDSLRHMLADVSEGTAWCRRAEFAVTLDASYQQPMRDSTVAIRTRAIAPVRVRGAQVLLDCARPNGKFDDFCGSQ
jgi:hypothetical protein